MIAPGLAIYTVFNGQVLREKLLVPATGLLCGLSSLVPVCRLHLCKKKQLLFLQMWTPRLN